MQSIETIRVDRNVIRQGVIAKSNGSLFRFKKGMGWRNAQTGVGTATANYTI